jgi:hypothetical protein
MVANVDPRMADLEKYGIFRPGIPLRDQWRIRYYFDKDCSKEIDPDDWAQKVSFP